MNHESLARRYDALVVGARCAGAATATLLARAGLRVLVVDKGSYGADALSTHALMRGGVVQLHRWGVLDEIVDAGTPPVRTTSFFYEGSTLDVPIRARGGVDALYAPRRTLLDRVLVDAARDAGAVVRYGMTLTALAREGARVTGAVLVDRMGAAVTIESDLVIGADGVHSKVGALAGAEPLIAGRHASALVYGYFRDAPRDAYRWYWGDQVAAGVIPTNDGLACIFTAVPPGTDAGFDRAIARVAPELVDATVEKNRAGALRTFRGERGHLRTAYGEGWALVGDAGFFKDPLTAHGISDALRDAELLARAVTRGPGSMRDYATVRDDLARGMLDVSDAIASFEWDEDRIQQLHVILNAEMKRGVAAIENLELLAA